MSSGDAADRDVSPALTVGEGDVDVSLRPRSLREFIGQARVREQLQLVIEGARNRGGTPDHILLSGPPGWQDVAGDDHRRRARVRVAGDVRARAGTRR